MLTKINGIVERMMPSKSMSRRTFDRVALVMGIFGPIFLAIAVVAPVFLPPIPPSWDANQVVQYYRDHHKGILASASCLALSGAGYSLSAAFVADQLTRIPNVPRAVAMIEQAAGNCVAMVVILCGLLLATAAYRLDRPAEITQMLNDMFWFTFVLPMPFFQVQSFAIIWAVMVDTRPKPYFPKYLAVPNVLMILVGFPCLATHVVYDGPLAWNGEFVFWTVTALFFVQQVIEWRSIWLAISSDPEASEASEAD